MASGKVKLFVTLSLLLFLSSSFFQVDVRAAEILLFEDDFEGYSVGTFPTGGGWTLWYSGLGSQYQIIVDDVSHSGEKALQLRGYADPIITQSWAAYAAKLVDTESPIIGFNVSVRVESLGDGDRDIARIGFASLLPPNGVLNYAPILFKNYGSIYAVGDVELKSYVADRWYNVSVILDRNSEEYSVWVDNVLLGECLPILTNKGDLVDDNPWGIEAFALSQNYYSKKAYFDDVKFFSVYDLDPYLELHPSSGISQTTLVGSGFAPNSKISATWNGTALHTVPEPLITNGNGNFTAIVTVLNQTALGKFEINVTDKLGNEAAATFNVIPEFPSWMPLLIMLVTLTVIAVIYKQRIHNLNYRRS